MGTFSPRGTRVFDIGYKGFKLFSIGFLVTGVNIFAPSMFTAFSNGRVSATISFLRTFVLIIAGIIILPKFLGVNGVWLAVPLAEMLSMIISLLYINKYKSVYGYGKDIDIQNKDKKQSYKDIKEL